LFYPDSILSTISLKTGLEGWIDISKLNLKKETINYKELLAVIKAIKEEEGHENISLKKLKKQGDLALRSYKLKSIIYDEDMSRKHAALLLDILLNPFELRQVNHFGELLSISR